MRTQPEQQAPPVQRLRIQYAKRGRLRFASHRDFSRAFERAVVRARVPMAYSSGFNPHPRISYAGAAPTGAASEAEYLEIALAETVEPGWVQERLAEVLPDGLDVIRVVESPGGALADRLQASRWRMELAAPYDAAVAAVAALLAEDSIVVERMTKKGLRSFDCRAAVMALEAQPAGDGSVLELVIRHAEPAVRPDDVLTGLARVADFEAGRAPRLSRLEQGPWDAESGRIADPLG